MNNEVNRALVAKKMKSVNYLRMLLPLLLLGLVGNVYGGTPHYNARLQTNIATASTGRGLVYVSLTSTAPSESNYTNDMQVTGADKENDNSQFVFYIYAKPIRGFKFDKWTVSNTANNKQQKQADYTNSTANTTVSTYGAKKEVTGLIDVGSLAYQNVVATASFTSLTPFNMTFKKADAPYSVSYTYAQLETDSKMETKEREAYTVSAENQVVSTYAGDQVKLSTAVTDGFLGWFKEGVTDPVDTHNPYTFTVPTGATAATYYPKWENIVVDEASVNGTNYETLVEAISAANAIVGGNVTVTLLTNILYYGTEPLELTRSMTINLNGKNLYGLAGTAFRVNGDGITVTLNDTGASKGKITVTDANAGQFQAIDVLRGAFINSGAIINVENSLPESDFTNSTMSCGVFVQPNGAFTNNSGTVTATSIANAYGVYSQGTTTITAGTITVTATTNVAYGIFATDGTVAINGGTINANAAMSACGVVTDGNAQGGAASATITTTTITARGSVQNAAAVRVIDGTVTVNGGTFNVNNTPTGAYGAASGAETIVKRKGYPNNGQLIINGGTFTTAANTTSGTGFALFVNPSITLPGTAGYVSTTVTGGKFKTTGKIAGVTNSTAAGVQISGGMYNVAIQALNHVKVGYYAKTLVSGNTGYSEGYRYQVIEGENTQAVCRIVEVAGLEFTTLEAALGYVSNHPEAASLRILMLKPYYMSKPGIYTLPSNAGLLLPWEEGQTDYYDLSSHYEIGEPVTPSVYMQLTLGGGVQLNVSGKIEIGGRQYIAGQGTKGAGIPTGAYGQLHLEPGCKITLLNGAILNAWGFVTGKGEIDARNGSEVHEQFQMMDWKGGAISSAMLKSDNPGVFPVSQYFIQNVEAPTTYHPGAALYAITGIYAASTPARAHVQLVGKDAATAADRDEAMFLMDPAAEQENTWVRKWYDAEHDLQVYEVNSSASLGSMTIAISGYNMNSKNYVLPVTNNMKIHLLSGNLGITQNTVLLPGSEIEIDKTATVAINENKSLYLYDTKQWDKYVFGKLYGTRVKYTPSFNGAPSDVQRKILNKNGSCAFTSATINAHGTFEVKGALFTTNDGANIYSTVADAGTIKFTTTTVAEGSVSQAHPNYEAVETGVSLGGQGLSYNLASGYVSAECTSAQLKNEDGTYTSTYIDAENHATAGQSYCFIDMNDGHGGRWTSLRTEGCFVLDEATGTYYAKPSDYVALKNGTTQNADHTYSSATGNRLFILMNDEDEGCQWWEVVYHEASGLYYCDKNNKYYFYDDGIGEWVVKMYTVSWFDWDGTPLKDEADEEITYFLPYGSMPVFNSSKPVTRPKETYYTYDFAGWEPELAPVTGDASYTAKFDRKDVMFTITFNWTENAVAQTHKDFLTANTMPTPPDGIDMTNKEWSPALSYVTGNAIYTLQDKDPEKTTYTIIYKNKNGDVLKKENGTDAIYQSGTIDVNGEATRTNYDGAIPTIKLADIPKDMNMVWDTENPWLPALTDKISQDMIYVAQYKSTPKTYTITWNWMDGVDAEHSTVVVSENVAYKAVPQYTGATPTKPSDATYHYTFSGWNTQEDGEGSNEIETATSDKTYYAKYDATFKDKVIATNETVDGGKQQTVTNLIITTDGTLTIPSTSRINATNLILEATSNASGQLITNANTSINVTGNAYFDWTPNGETGTASRTWYAIAVPWEVDAENGIFLKETGRHLVIGQDFDLIYYDGATRASQGNKPACWKYVQHDPDKTMHPGQLYMMYFDPGFKTIRFAKKSGSAVIYNSPVNVSTYSASDDKDANWNGIANPRTYYASLSAGSATYAQVLNNGNLDDYFANPGAPVYQTINLGESKFTVGKPLFVQATGNDAVVVTKQTSAGIVNAAPRRARVANLPQGIAAVYRLAIAGEDQPEADNLFVQVAEDEKADRYTIGLDLVKGGVASGRAQVWVNRYNAKLSVNTQALSDDEATYPLTIQVPANGDYVLSVGANENEDYALYLIWNLSEEAYTANLEKGAHTNYGLRVSARAPQITTGIDEAVVDAKGETRKVLINNTVYIIRGENVYSVDGQLVK